MLRKKILSDVTFILWVNHMWCLYLA